MVSSFKKCKRIPSYFDGFYIGPNKIHWKDFVSQTKPTSFTLVSHVHISHAFIGQMTETSPRREKRNQ